MKKLKIKIIVADYYKEITNPLTKSCVNILEQNNLKYEIITVPGVYEIPQMIKWKIKPSSYNLFIALGCVIKGQTYHFEVIANEVTFLSTKNETDTASQNTIKSNEKSESVQADSEEEDKDLPW